MAVFSDLNVPCGTNLADRLTFLTKMGYQLVAVNNTIEMPQKESKNKITIKAPEEIKVDESKFISKDEAGGPKPKFRQLSRLTMVLDNPEQIHSLQSCAEIQAYDLIAIQPTSEKLLHVACGTLDIDIISLDFTEKLLFKIKKTSLNLALERGVVFEILYSPLIEDSGARRFTISNTQKLLDVCKGKNIIITSGCEKPLLLRGPYDVVTLGLLLGMNNEQSKDSITKNCRAALVHAQARKMTKSVVSAVKVGELSSRNQWALQACKELSESEEEQESDESSDHSIETPVKKKCKLEII